MSFGIWKKKCNIHALLIFVKYTLFYLAFAAPYTVSVLEGDNATLKWVIPSDLATAPQYEIFSGLRLLYVIKKDRSGAIKFHGGKRFGDRISAKKINHIIEVKIHAVQLSDEITVEAIAKYSYNNRRKFGEAQLKVIGKY